MFKKLILAPIAAVVTLSGCAPTGSSTFRDMSAAYREVLEGYANDNVLLNIVRSSKNMPVSFLDMPSVIGTGSVGVNAGIGGTVFSSAPASIGGFFSADPSAGLSTYAPSVGLSVNSSFNFTQSSLDNSQFMSSFLSDIRPEVVASLTNKSDQNLFFTRSSLTPSSCVTRTTLSFQNTSIILTCRTMKSFKKRSTR